MIPSQARHLSRSLAVLAGVSGVAIALPLIGTKLGTEYKESRVFDVSVTSEISTETTASEMTIDGEPAGGRGGRGGGFGGGRTTKMSYSYSDTILAAADGAPTKVRRAFESVEGGTEMEGRDDVIEIEMQSAFDGLTILLSATDEGVTAEVPEGEAPDAERLEGHVLALPLDGLVPDGEVEPGAEWEIEGEALMAAFGTALQAKLIDRPERPERGGEREGRGRGRGGWTRGGGGGQGMLASGEWDITATLTDKTEEIDGVTALVISIAAEVEGEPPAREGRGGRDFAAGIASESSAMDDYSGEFEGTLYWSAEEKRPVRFEMKGTYELNTVTERDTERGAFRSSRTQETTIEISIDVAARTAEK